MIYDPDNPLGLSTATLERVDELCVQFERAWKSGSRPLISDFLPGVPEQARSVLLHELLLLDVDYRRTQGERPVDTEYAALFPDDAALIQTIFSSADDTNDGGQPIGSHQEAPAQPHHFGRYVVVERIGEGGFGTLYRAHDEELQRDVAVKVPHPHLVHRPAAIELFRKEARALATLRHPAIVPVYDVHFDEYDPSACFVVAEFMQGGDLADFVDQQPLTHRNAARCVGRIATALHYAHGCGLVHRDVKLSNILRDADGQVYIADFGLALRDEEMGHGNGYAGTPANMSPEQARGDGHLVDGRTDVYGLGVVLYELLTGRRPFNEKDVPKLLAEIQNREPKPPRQIDDSIPTELERICLKALAKHPSDRYSTAIDMARDLERFQRPPSAPRWSSAKIWWAGAIVTALLALWFIPRESGIPASDSSGTIQKPGTIRTLAVLPFQPMGEGEQSTYLGLGMADSLITKLSNLRQVVVRPTATVQDYVEPTADPIELGQKLRVDAVLEGTIQQNADQTRMTVRLLRVADGKALWAGTFDEDSVDLFALQDLISTQVARALVLQLTTKEQARLERRHTENRQAYEAYVKGRYHWNQRAKVAGGELGKAIQYFKEAIDADPLYALAYSGLAESYALLNVWSGELDETAFPRARAAAKRALELDTELTQAHATFALISFYYDWNWDRAEQEFRRAIELNPNYATAHQWYAEMLYFSTRFDEAIAELRKAAELDPLSPVIAGLQSTPYLWRRDYQRARRELLKAVERTPNSAVVLFGLGLCAEQESRFEQALDFYKKQSYEPGQAVVLAKMGKQTESRKLLNQMLKRAPHPASPYHIALVHIALGESDQAFEQLNEAKKSHDEHMVWLQVDPRLDPVRDDPRFIRLLKDVGWIE